LDFFYSLNWRAFGMIIIGNDIPDDTNLYFFIGDIQKFGAAYRVERCRLSTRLLGAIEVIGAAKLNGPSNVCHQVYHYLMNL
jgi:hypothetical protein